MIEVELRGVKELLGDLRDFPKELESEVINRLSQVAYDSAQRGASRHIVTKALLQSLYNKPIKGGRKVGHDTKRAPQAVWVVEGTPPHDIPKEGNTSAKTLRWPGPDGFIYAKKVKHPGYKGDDYIKRAKDDAIRAFDSIVSVAMSNSL